VAHGILLQGNTHEQRAGLREGTNLGRVSQKNLLPKVLGKDRRNLQPLMPLTIHYSWATHKAHWPRLE